MMTLNHGFSGYISARAAMPLARKFLPLPEGTIAFASFIGAMLPDIDAVTNTLERGLYFSQNWYGHRNASHSILGTLILALLAALPMAGWLARRKGMAWRAAYSALVPCFWFGGVVHIVGDLFTPRLIVHEGAKVRGRIDTDGVQALELLKQTPARPATPAPGKVADEPTRLPPPLRADAWMELDTADLGPPRVPAPPIRVPIEPIGARIPPPPVPQKLEPASPRGRAGGSAKATDRSPAEPGERGGWFRGRH